MKNQIREHGMIMRSPATRWQDALPTGNGAIGAMMYGQICRDVILLNHHALYYPIGRPETLDVSDQLAELRRLMDQGHYAEAEQLMPRVYAERAGRKEGPTRQLRDPYQPFCDIQLNATVAGIFRNYRRGVDFETGRVWTRWADEKCTMTRELFVSRANDTVYLRICGSKKGTVSGRIVLREHDTKYMQGNGWGANNKIKTPVFTHAVSEDGFLTFTGQYSNGFTFGAVGRVSIVHGHLRVDKNELVIEDADELQLRVRLFMQEDPCVAIPRLSEELRQESSDFDAELTRHAKLHRELFTRMQLDLCVDEQRSNEELLMQAYDGEVPTALVQTLFEFGRHLLICSSRPGGWPANLQGLWNGDYAPAWDSDFHQDENIQMNYWQALPGHLPEMALPFFDYFEKWMDDYRENARKIFGCRGIYVPLAQTTHGLVYPDNLPWTNWTAAAGWLAQLFYDYYLFTGDKEFLARRAVPWLKETALFYEDFLTIDENGVLLFSPSMSPENTPSGEGMGQLTMNATMDVAVCREVLGNLCAACECLGIERESVPRWRAMVAKLPKYAVNEDGALREWLHPTFKDNYQHRHLSHLYPLFPGFEISKETDPVLDAACRIAVEKRQVIGLTSQSGWSLAHMANIYARLGMGDQALECLELLSRSCTGMNLLTYHNDWRDMGLTLSWAGTPPFQIDANMGIAAAVLEMLVFSKPGLIRLLPAMPKKWPVGRAHGLAARGGIQVDVEWDLNKGLFQAELTSQIEQQVMLRMPDGSRNVRSQSKGVLMPCNDHETIFWNIGLRPLKPVRIKAELRV